MALLGRDDEIGGRAPNVPVLTGGVQLSEHIGMVLEPDQEVLDDLCAEMAADTANLARSNLRRDDDRCIRQRTRPRELTELEVSQKRRQLLPGNEPVIALAVG